MKKWLFSGDSDSNLGLLLLRIVSSASLMTHGYAKLFGGKLAGHIQYVTKLGLPFPSLMAHLSALAEFAAPLCIVVGLLTRPMAAIIAINMSVAVFIAHKGTAFGARELGIAYLVISLFFFLKGAGRWSLDRMIRG